MLHTNKFGAPALGLFLLFAQVAFSTEEKKEETKLTLVKSYYDKHFHTKDACTSENGQFIAAQHTCKHDKTIKVIDMSKKNEFNAEISFTDELVAVSNNGSYLCSRDSDNSFSSKYVETNSLKHKQETVVYEAHTGSGMNESICPVSYMKSDKIGIIDNFYNGDTTFNNVEFIEKIDIGSNYKIREFVTLDEKNKTIIGLFRWWNYDTKTENYSLITYDLNKKEKIHELTAKDLGLDNLRPVGLALSQDKNYLISMIYDAYNPVKIAVFNLKERSIYFIDLKSLNLQGSLLKSFFYQNDLHLFSDNKQKDGNKLEILKYNENYNQLGAVTIEANKHLILDLAKLVNEYFGEWSLVGNLGFRIIKEDFAK